MKKNLIHQILFLLCIGGCALTIIIASSCEDKTSAQVHNPNEPITVTNFYPDSGGIATQFTKLSKMIHSLVIIRKQH